MIDLLSRNLTCFGEKFRDERCVNGLSYLIGSTGSTVLPPQDIVLYRNDNIPLCDAFKIVDRAGDTKTTIIVFNNNKVGKSDTYKLITTCTPNGNAGGGYNGAVIFELQFYGRERA